MNLKKIKIDNIKLDSIIEEKVFVKIINSYIDNKSNNIILGKSPTGARVVIENNTMYLYYKIKDYSSVKIKEILENNGIDTEDLKTIEDFVDRYRDLENKRAINFIERLPYIFNEYIVFIRNNKIKDWKSEDSVEQYMERY